MKEILNFDLDLILATVGLTSDVCEDLIGEKFEGVMSSDLQSFDSLLSKKLLNLRKSFRHLEHRLFDLL